MQLERTTLVPLGILIGLQVLDVVVHFATKQIEPIRITSNVIIAGGAILAVLPAIAISRLAVVLSATVYLLLNLAFLAQHGLVNPGTDALRIPLFAFVVGSLLLIYWLRLRLPDLSE